MRNILAYNPPEHSHTPSHSLARPEEMAVSRSVAEENAGVNCLKLAPRRRGPPVNLRLPWQHNGWAEPETLFFSSVLC